MTTKLRTSYVHRGGYEPLIGLPIPVFLADVAKRHPEREALVSLPQNVRMTYRELMHETDRLAKAFLAFGIQRGDRVGIWGTDSVEWALTQLATARIGAVLVNVNPAFRVPELEHALRAARVQSLLLMPAFKKSNYVERLIEVCPATTRTGPDEFRSKRLPDLDRVVIFDPDKGDDVERPASGFWTWPEILALGESVDDAALDARTATLEADDPINIQFTSGTTGSPKPVVLTHHNILNNAWFVGRAMKMSHEDRLCVPLPFYHCFGMVVSNLCSWAYGATLVIPAPHFEAGAVLAAVHKERCTVLHGVPTMFIAEFERPDFEEYDLTSLRTGIMAGAPCPPELVKKVANEMGMKEILIGYGQTEASPVTHLTTATDSFERRVNTVGFNLQHQETKIVDPNTGVLQPIGEVGEICFRGYHVMRGYFEDEASTKETIDEGNWLHSGDLGTMDEDGYVTITGRLKNMIIRGGENIYPVEIETHYFTHPKIAQIAVFGVPDDRMGEEVAAWIQLHEGETATEEELRAFGKEGLAHFKIPRYMRIVDEFPMTVTGKIQKFRMKEEMAKLLVES
ncbi:MAG: AMP-binding protein [Planctomycetota bacterium]|nr:AMP-binding protein [Planctomycetota bacterium]